MRNTLSKIWQHWHVAWFPPSSPHKTEPAAMLSLDWATVRDRAPPRFSFQVQIACKDPFLSAKGTIPIDIHCQLCEVYGPGCMEVRNAILGSVRTACNLLHADLQAFLAPLLQLFRPKSKADQNAVHHQLLYVCI